VNNRLDAVTVVGDYVRLEQKSGRWWGRCPFHGGGQEKTPSFKVDPDLKMYHCFGCSKGGSVISFVMEMDKLTYPEAIKNLAKKMGIEVIYDNDKDNNYEQNNTLKEELYELYARTTVTFQHFLKEKPQGKEALKYIKERGFSIETIETFKLGFSPQDRDFLFNFLKQKGYSEEFLGKSGLFSSNYKNIPLFSGRLMFPITDRQGRINAFGGRALPGLQSDNRETPKYINSPETEIYKKGQTLFALDLAKNEMRQTKTVYLAEGYIDVMALHQAGILNSVAPLGTAFTDEQAAWLRRWVEKVILIFDNDEAGKKAAYKAIITCRKNGLICSVADPQKDPDLTEESGIFKDPADILHKFGPDILKKKMKFIINDFEYLISQNQSGVNSVSFMFQYLEALDSEVERSDSISRIADIYRIERNAVQKDYLQWKSAGGSRVSSDKQESQKVDLQIRRNSDLSLLTVVALNMELYSEFRSAMEIKEIEDPAAKELFIVLEECFKYDETGLDALLLRINDNALRNYISDKAVSGEFKVNVHRFMEDGINKIRRKRLDKRLTEINALMRESERNGEDIVNIDELLAEKKSIDSQIRKLEGR